jgi:glycosyltransferase involved in cell wall biosynthesis
MKISVAIIAYNSSEYIKNQIDSILEQTHNVDEIIIFEDASTDNTKEILEAYKNKNPNLFTIHYNSQNIGIYKNIEKAIKSCTGEIIILADHDDFWYSNKVETILKWFNSNPNMNGVFTNGSIMNSEEIINNNYCLWDVMGFPYKSIKNNNDLKLYINTVENAVTGATLAFRNNLPFLNYPFPTIKNLVHDRWIAMNLAENNSLGILDEKIIRYRIHSKQAIGGKTKETEKYIRLNKDILDDIPNIDSSINNFKDLRYILNKIEINLQIQNGINKLPNVDLASINYIEILKKKHNNYNQYGAKRWPILSFIRKMKRLIIDKI